MRPYFLAILLCAIMSACPWIVADQASASAAGYANQPSLMELPQPDYVVALRAGDSRAIPFVSSDLSCYAVNGYAYRQIRTPRGYRFVSPTGRTVARWTRATNRYANVTVRTPIICAGWRG